MVVLDQKAKNPSFTDVDSIPLSVYHKGIWELWKINTNLSWFRTICLFSFSEITSFRELSKFICILSLCCLKHSKDHILIGDPMGRPLYYTHVSLFPPESFGFQFLFACLFQTSTLSATKDGNFYPYSRLKILKWIKIEF